MEMHYLYVLCHNFSTTVSSCLKLCYIYTMMIPSYLVKIEDIRLPLLEGEIESVDTDVS